MGEMDEKLAASLKTLTDAAKSPEGARNILAMLFPKVDEVLETYVPTEHTGDFGQIRERRISRADFAPAYFRLDPTPVSWSRPELEEIIELGPEEAFAVVEVRVSKFPEKDNAHLRRLFLDFLTATLSQGEAFGAEWFYHLMAVSPKYIHHRERKPGDLLGDDGFQPFNRLLYEVLRRRSPQARFSIIAGKIKHLPDLSVLADFFRSAVGDLNDGGARQRDVTYFGDQTEALRAQLLERVRSFAKSGKIWGQVSPARQLWFWWGSNRADEVRDFLSQSLRDPKALLKVLDLVIGQVVSSNGNYERVGSGYEKLVNLDELKVAASELLQRQPSHENAAAVERFMQALKNSEDRSF